MPNRTDTIRTMIALVYFRQFHYLPDDPNVFRPLPAAVSEGLSEGARSIYRHHPAEAD